MVKVNPHDSHLYSGPTSVKKKEKEKLQKSILWGFNLEMGPPEHTAVTAIISLIPEWSFGSISRLPRRFPGGAERIEDTATPIQPLLMRAHSRRWQGYSGWNSFLWIEPPKILCPDCNSVPLLLFCQRFPSKDNFDLYVYLQLNITGKSFLRF